MVVLAKRDPEVQLRVSVGLQLPRAKGAKFMGLVVQSLVP